jgi:hypothetical protein
VKESLLEKVKNASHSERQQDDNLIAKIILPFCLSAKNSKIAFSQVAWKSKKFTRKSNIKR